MNALQKYEMYKAYKDLQSRDFVLNDQFNFKWNAFCDTAINLSIH